MFLLVTYSLVRGDVNVTEHVCRMFWLFLLFALWSFNFHNFWTRCLCNRFGLQDVFSYCLALINFCLVSSFRWCSWPSCLFTCFVWSFETWRFSLRFVSGVVFSCIVYGSRSCLCSEHQLAWSQFCGLARSLFTFPSFKAKVATFLSEWQGYPSSVVL